MNRFGRSLTRAAFGAACAAALVLTGCSSGGSGASAASDAAGSGSSDAGVAYAQEQVDKVKNAVNDFTSPGPALTDVAAQSGKTVYYIPAQYAVPLFKILGDSLTTALGRAGVKVQICDAKSNPSSTASCLQQAIDAKAGAVITGSLPEEFAPSQFKAVRDAGIPFLNLSTVPAGPGDPTKVAFLTPDYTGQQALNADWVIADSKGKAEVLVVHLTDNPATTAWMEQGALKEYKERCPGCTVTVVRTTTNDLQKLPTLISSAVLKDPKITYVQAQFDSVVQATIQGLQATPNGRDIKVVSHDGTLAALQQLKAGNYVAAEFGYNLDALAWYGADQVLRMMTGAPAVQNEQFPFRRLFDKSNVGGLDLTGEGQSSGRWYGSADYRAGFTKLWGLAG